MTRHGAARMRPAGDPFREGSTALRRPISDCTAAMRAETMRPE